MKKLGILVMAMILVVGMSLGVMAAKGPLPLEEGMGVDISVEELGILTLDGPEVLQMTIEDFMDAEASPYESQPFSINVAANTEVNVMVEQTYSNWEDIFGGMPKGRVFWGESNNDNWVISPDVINETDNSNMGGKVDQAVLFASLDSGKNEIDARMQVQLNDTVEWYEFEAGEDKSLEGNVTFTVEAQ